jgi:tRNA nucleotidyltransferase (CCA-adding enzyme)
MSLFFYRLHHKELQKVIREFAFHKGESSRIISLKENYEKAERELRKKDIRPSCVYRLLQPLPYETILLIRAMSRHRQVHHQIENFLFVFHSHKLVVKGENLSQLGIKPGPHYKKILEELLYAKIDGKVKTKEEELKFAQRLSQ